jgi:hypothetical protein
MNTYQAFYKGKSIQVQAASSYAAQLKAAEVLKIKHAYQVTILLIALADGKEIVHNPAEI